MPKLVSANNLATGAVVFRGEDGGWVARVEEAAVYDDAVSADLGLAAAQADVAHAIVVDPFLVERTDKGEGRAPMTLRDTIRAYGPTIDYLPALGPSAA